MKKYILMTFVAALFAASAWGIKSFAQSVPAMEAVTVGRGETTVKIRCSGRIEEEGACEMYAQIPLAAKQVYVKEGDCVSKGDRIAMIDSEATLRNLGREFQSIFTMMGIEELWPEEWLIRAAEGNGWIPQYITAAADGEITQLELSPYHVTKVNEPVATISAGGQRFVRLEVRESDISSVEEGQTVSISGAGLTETYMGTIYEIASQASTNGNTGDAVIDVFVSVENTDKLFRTGLTVSGLIEAQTLSNVVVVPHEAVQIDESCQEYVMVYSGGKTRKRVVEVLNDIEEGYLIGRGLEEGDIILLNHGHIGTGAWVKPHVMN